MDLRGCIIPVILASFAVCATNNAQTTRPQRAPSQQVETQLNDAGMLIQSGRLEEAETAIRKIISTNPRSAEAHTLLGVILDQRGLPGEAEKEYGAALRLKPNLVGALWNAAVSTTGTNPSAEPIRIPKPIRSIEPRNATALR